ncbi:hypothetical protein ACOYXV_19060 [Aeromonas veronii]
MSDEQWQTTIQSKLMGQINLVNIGLNYINQGGSFTLISGILNIKPIPLAIADATTSGAIDTFVQCVAHELPAASASMWSTRPYWKRRGTYMAR